MLERMCGRFYVTPTAIDLAVAVLPPDQQAAARAAIRDWIEHMNAPHGHYDVRPTNQIPVITSTGLMLMRWGFKTDKSNAVFNARSESLRFPIWREPLVLRRAVIAVGGFFEWTGTRGSKNPHAIHRADGNAMLLGALWTPNEEVGPSFSIVTTPATKWMQPLHNRMPLVLEREQVSTWLDLTRKPPEIKALIQPYAGALQEFACASPSRDNPPKADKGSLF